MNVRWNRADGATVAERASVWRVGRAFFFFGWLGVLVPVLIACGTVNTNHPQDDFLRTESAVWNNWMDAVVDVHLKEVPLCRISEVAPFERMNCAMHFSLNGSQAGADSSPSPSQMLISFDARSVTRREALRLIALKYDLVMGVGRNEGRPFSVTITTR